MSRRRTDEGSTLLVSMFIVMLAFLVSMAVTTRATLTVGAVQRALWEAHAFNAAEAGLAVAVQDVMAGTNSELGRDLPYGLASFRIEKTDRGRHGPWRRLQILTHGQCKAVHVVLEAKVLIRHRYGEVEPEVKLLEWRQLPPGTGS